MALTTALGWSLVGSSFAQTPPSASAGPTGKTTPPVAGAESVVLPESVPDPLEPVNRIVYGFNQEIMGVVVRPTAKVYRFIVIKPVRTGIGNFGRNITFPGRLFNNLLQGKWSGARDEAYRFGCNTTVGIAGFIDVASKWKIPKSDADFGQTFGQWGWKPACYVMLPIFGPSNERDTLGLAADTAANPLTYIAPYPAATPGPLTYVSPYTYISYGIMYNNLSDTVNEYARFNEAEMDAYSELQYAWTFVRENRVADFQVKGQPDAASLETLESVFFTFQNPEFPGRGKTRSVLIPTTGRKLKFTFWLQPGKAPVVYIVPGLGSHRLAEPALALAELVYQKGFSAVCVSSTFNFEFMEHASTAEAPSYMPVDVHDLHVALTEIAQRLEKLYPQRMGSRALMGYSMGGFEALFVAATESTQEARLLKFDRYVAINSPVGLLHGISKLDEYFQAPLAWPAGERADNIENTFLKVAALSKNSLTPQTSLPFSGIESRFLIGMAFRLILRDAIFSSQQRNNQGVLEHPLRKLRRAAVYREILQYSYQDYLQKFVIPYYWSRGIDLSTPDSLEQASSLRPHAAGLQANPNIRLIVNRDDFLLPDEDLAWLKTIFTEDQLTVFERGGHLGNLSHPAVQKAILEALEGLKSSPPKSD
ncbi:MAG TPA: VacJ family lipoprotein [Candidatus Acidoferrum sp.]|nr:VacJ family lipoprotein [Candidatus Acidoferrum sp.]